MGICLIKAIVFALLSVFVLMPGLLVLFGPPIDKTRHKDFVPKIPFVGKIDYATRFIVPVVFVVVAVLGLHFSNNCPYAYGYSTLETPKLNETQIAQNMVEDHFGSSNMVALVVPAGDYETEARLLSDLEGYEQVDHTMGLANVEAMDGYMLADKLTPRQFAELAGLDYEAAQLVYAAYAASQEELSLIHIYAENIIKPKFLFAPPDEKRVGVKQENAGEHRNDPAAELHRHARRVAAARGIDERALREERDDVEHGDHADAGEDVGRVEPLIFADAVHRQLWEKFQLHARSPPVVSMVSVSAIFW